MEVKTLENLKKVELEILHYIDDFCKKEKISYWLEAGTLLGAVRHKGFIPWDDDIDIAMLRQDYENFVEKFEKIEHKDYKIKRNSKGSHRFIKVISTEKTLLLNNEKHDIFVDIFPFDYYTKNQVNFLNNFIELHKNRKSGFSNKLKDMIVEIKREIRKNILFKIKFEKNGNEKYIGHGIENDFKIQLNEEKDIFPLKELKYENGYFKVPNNYDKYLTLMYGDYMKFPPLNERKPSHFNFNIKE